MYTWKFVALLLVIQTSTLSQAQERRTRDPCQNFKCQNGGSCTAPADAPYCLCPPQYTGQLCETRILSRDPCQDFVCQNGGSCTAPADAPYCVCATEYTGQFCENIIRTRDPCQNFKCQNGGSCTAPADAPYCLCPPQYTGQLCETRILSRDPCQDFVCQNGGSCTAPADAPYCVCATEYTGQFCENIIRTRDPCQNFKCQNGGSCTAPADAPYCLCPPQYTGQLCETRILSRDPCQDFVCQNGGSCTAPADAPYCVCATEYTGQFCENIIRTRDPCQNFKCQNGGSCTAPADAPYCLCPPQYTGQLCETRIYSRNPCMFYKCQNGGMCTSPLDKPICDCPPGYGGKKCEDKPGLCPTSGNSSDVGICITECEDDGKCLGLDKCCPTACGGRLCTNDTIMIIDPCDKVCFNRGKCSVPADVPVCECPDGFSGDRCELFDNSRQLGSCPVIKPGTFGVCGGVMCTDDDNCTSQQKCCLSACGGNLCTPVENSVFDPCDGFCLNGGSCYAWADEAMCTCPFEFNGERCQNEGSSHPGSCPYVEPGDVGVCGGLFCTTDDNCASDEKCCPSICGSNLCTMATDVTTPPPPPPPLTCSNILCAIGTYCRSFASCSTCQLEYGCIPKENVWEGIDSECQRQKYSNVVLMKDPNNSSLYSQLKCRESDDGQACPSGSACMYDQTGGGTCCRGPSVPVTPTKKPGDCPSGEVFVCGGRMCSSDNQCPGAQKCCPGCGNMCVDPVKDMSCGNSNCSAGETCVEKQLPCPPGHMCHQALTPICVPDECANCTYNEDCNITLSGHVCFPYKKLDLCGGCSDDKVCIDTGIRCIKAPCPTFQCVDDNECGGCRNGQICKSTGIVCITAPCPSFECVDDNECGGCLNGQICKDMGIVCITTPCPTFQCVKDNECGGCPNGQVCKPTELQCEGSPCPSFKCYPESEPECPLRCPANFACQIQPKKCSSNIQHMCGTALVPSCVRIKPELRSCRKVTIRLLPRSLLCMIERSLFQCRSDSDCRKSNERCCSSACGNKQCRAVNRRTVGSD